MFPLGPAFPLVCFLPFHEAFYWGKCALHSICTEIVIFYCIYLKQTGCFRIKNSKITRSSSQMWYVSPVFISCRWQLKRVNPCRSELRCYLPKLLLYNPTICGHIFIVISLLVFSSTVLCCLILPPLWWLNGDSPVLSRRLLFDSAYVGFQVVASLGFERTTLLQFSESAPALMWVRKNKLLICWISIWDHSG